MADEAYRAVFLRVHPTGKMVLSLTTEPDGNEGALRRARRRRSSASRRSTSRSCPPTRTASAPATASTRARPAATPAAIASATEKIRAKAQLLAGAALETPADGLRVGRRRVRRRGRRRRRSPTSRSTRTAPARCRRASRAGSTRRRSTGTSAMVSLGPEHGTLTVRTGKGGADRQGRPQPGDRGHALAGARSTPRRAIELTADARSLRVRSGQRRHVAARRRGEGRDRADDRRGGPQGRLDRVPLEPRDRARRRPRRRGRARPARRPPPARVRADAVDDGHLTGSATVKQTDWRIKPYSALFGTLKVADDVEVAIDATLPRSTHDG